MFLEISQNSQEITCARASFLIKLQVQVALVLSCEFYERFGAHYLKSQYFWKTKFFVETWNFDRKIRFIDLILEKLGFSIWKTWFINLKIDLSDENLGFYIEILGFFDRNTKKRDFSIEILGFSNICDKWLPQK